MAFTGSQPFPIQYGVKCGYCNQDIKPGSTGRYVMVEGEKLIIHVGYCPPEPIDYVPMPVDEKDRHKMAIQAARETLKQTADK